MFGLNNSEKKYISKKKFIEYLICYVDRKISKEEFFNCDKNCKIIAGRFELDKNDLNFKYYDFSGIDLNSFQMSVYFTDFKPYEIKFSNANFTLTNISSSFLNYIDFQNTNFSNSKMSIVHFNYSNLKNSIWVETCLENTKLLEANLENIRLTNLDPKPIKFENMIINPKNLDFKITGTCSYLEEIFSKIFKSMRNFVIVFFKKENLEIPIGIIKNYGDNSFLLIQDIKIQGSIYPKGICFRVEENLITKMGFIENSKIYKIVLDRINLQNLKPISSRHIKKIFKNIDILLKKIENNEIEFEEILID